MIVWGYDMIWYDMIWYDMIWYDVIWYDMIWYNMISCYMILMPYDAMPIDNNTKISIQQSSLLVLVILKWFVLKKTYCENHECHRIKCLDN